LNRKSWIELTLSAVVLIFAFPPFPTGIMALVALVPLFFFANEKSPREGFIGGFVTGLIWTCGTVYWIAWPTIPGFLGTLLIVPLYTALFLWLLVILRNLWGEKALWVAPFLWTTLEYFSSIGPFAFPWNLLCYTQTFRLEPLQMAHITGLWGISFWVVTVNVCFYFFAKKVLAKQSAVLALMSTLALALAPWIYGTIQLKQQPTVSPDVNIAMIQGNVDPQLKWTPAFKDSNFSIYQHLTDEARTYEPDLIVWPETATACYLTHLRYSRYMRRIRAQLTEMKTPLLTGSPDYRFLTSGKLERYNSALLIKPFDFHVKRYHKISLVPFSERVPFVDKLPFLLKVGDYFKLGMGNFTPGDSTVVFNIEKRRSGTATRFSPLICYDSVFPDLVRQSVSRGAEFLVLITNDGWFGRTSGPYQHARIAILRAIENRRWIARCANTGISLCIDPAGRIHGKTALNEATILSCKVGANTERTFYNRHGGIMIKVLAGITMVFCGIGVLCFFQRKRKLQQLLYEL